MAYKPRDTRTIPLSGFLACNRSDERMLDDSNVSLKESAIRHSISVTVKGVSDCANMFVMASRTCPGFRTFTSLTTSRRHYSTKRRHMIGKIRLVFPSWLSLKFEWHPVFAYYGFEEDGDGSGHVQPQWLQHLHGLVLEFGVEAHGRGGRVRHAVPPFPAISDMYSVLAIYAAIPQYSMYGGMMPFQSRVTPGHGCASTCLMMLSFRSSRNERRHRNHVR